MSNLANRMLKAGIEDCTASAGYAKHRRSGSIGTIALWATVAALLVAYVVFK